MLSGKKLWADCGMGLHPRHPGASQAPIAILPVSQHERPRQNVVYINCLTLELHHATDDLEKIVRSHKQFNNSTMQQFCILRLYKILPLPPKNR
jgi:hypothetical protein